MKRIRSAFLPAKTQRRFNPQSRGVKEETPNHSGEEAGKADVRVDSSKRGAKFCPKCGSTEIYWARGLPQLWSIWECRRCGYRGALIIEDGELSKKLQEEYEKKHPRRDRSKA